VKSFRKHQIQFASPAATQQCWGVTPTAQPRTPSTSHGESEAAASEPSPSQRAPLGSQHPKCSSVTFFTILQTPSKISWAQEGFEADDAALLS